MIRKLRDLLFQNKNLKQTITKNIFWLFFGQIFSRLIRAIIVIYAARILGATEYGVFSYVLSLAAFFTIFSDIGINQIITKEVSRKPERGSHYFSTAFWIKILLFLATALLMIIILPHFAKIEGANLLIPLAALIVIFDGAREFCLSFFRAKEKMELEAIVMTITNFSITAFGFVALYLSKNSYSLTFSYMVATALGALVAISILNIEFRKIFKYFDSSLIKSIITAAWPITLVGILGAFMLNTDTLMLGWFRSAQEIGYYSAAMRIIQIIYTLPIVISSAIFSPLSQLIEKNEHEKAKILIEKGIALIFLIAMPISIGGLILGKPIIELVYGPEYIPALLTFQILSLTALTIFPTTLISNSILAYGQQKKMTKYIAVAAIGNLIFDLLLIPFYGIAGSAFATLLSQFISNNLSWKFLKNINNFKTLPYIKKIALSSIIMAIISFVLQKTGVNVIVNIAISSAIYFFILYLLKETIIWEIKSIIK